MHRFKMFLRLMMLIAISEAAVMAIHRFFEAPQGFAEDLLNAGLLVILSAPLLYYGVTQMLARRPSARASCRRHLSSCLAVGLYAPSLLMFGIPGRAQDRSTVDLSKASLEDLMNVQVTSVSKKEEKLSHVPAAIFVITQEEIRRSGATNIPDLLRMVPGVDVAQINANTWAISARGFNGQLANKMLVMIDGRTVYDPSFAGVYLGLAGRGSGRY